MRWHLTQTLPWQEPLTLAARCAGQPMALLYSGLSEQHTGQTSYLFLSPITARFGAAWERMPLLEKNGDALPDWVGYLGYEMGEDVPPTPDAPIPTLGFQMVRYGILFRFNHTLRVVDVFSRGQVPAPAPIERASDVPAIIDLTSNMSRADYIATIAQTVARIEAGDFYQANITRKFHGQFASEPDGWSLFSKLVEASPAPYSAYIHHNGLTILSSSPECFLTLSGDGTITTRPIKGSARRGATPEEDTTIQADLLASEKNHAENLMIVDLMRNDLARVSEPESVRVTEQSGLYSYATIHHLISTITAQKRLDQGTYDVIRACFPPGSMTGAPKIAAMRWCAGQEAMQRGVYSGAIGWFGGDGSCDLSVTIRTLLLKGTQFEFQVGGGIVADSTPEDEWRETLIKARGICKALGIDEKELEAI